MRKHIVTGLCALFFCITAFAGDPKPKQKHKRVKPDGISAMSSRIVGNRWHNAAEVVAINLIPYQGNDDTEELVGFVEFGDGGIGIYVAHDDEDDDEWVTLTKQEAKSTFFEGVMRRAQLR